MARGRGLIRRGGGAEKWRETEEEEGRSRRGREGGTRQRVPERGGCAAAAGEREENL
jgi:hypothetical protein